MRYLPLLGLFFYFACSNPPESSSRIADELSVLTDTTSHRLFLERLLREDQEVRHAHSAAIQRHASYDHPEVIAAGEAMMRTDDYNTALIEAYLDRFGYPDPAVLGEGAALLPVLVIHHASNDTGIRRRKFPLLYRAFRDGYISDGFFALYLNRLYQMENGEQLRLEGRFRESTRIDSLIKLLQLPVPTTTS